MAWPLSIGPSTTATAPCSEHGPCGPVELTRWQMETLEVASFMMSREALPSANALELIGSSVLRERGEDAARERA